MKVRPVFWKGIKNFIFITYGIKDGKVYINNSFMGFKFGDRPEIKVENVTRTFPKGGMVGDVVFGEGSHNPVIWKNVFRPEKLKLKADRLIKEIKNNAVVEGSLDSKANLSDENLMQGIEAVSYTHLTLPTKA